jgi:DNA-binding LacI/PurR family transcriptional regulator
MQKDSTGNRSDAPIYKRIQDDLQRSILSKKLKAGDILPRRSDIAKQYDTTAATVNKAFTELSREGLIVSKSGSRTYVSNKIETKAPAIAIVWSFSDEIMSFGRGYYAPLIDGVRLACSEHEVDVAFRTAPVSQYSRTLSDTRAQGLLVLAPNLKDQMELEELHAIGIPIIAVPGLHRQTSMTDISSDHRGGIHAAVNHLYNLGHKDIAFLGLTISMPDHYERLQGFLESMADLELPIGANRLRVDSDASDFDANVAAWLDASNLPTALITSDFVMCEAVLKRLKELGASIPKDISVIHFDETHADTYLDPPMTTIAQNVPMLGKIAVETLLKQINQETVPPSIIVPTELIVRKSTAPPRQ